MTQLREVYRCDICGNVIEMVNEGAGELVCCGQPMEKLEAKKEDEGKEKHVPVLEGLAVGVKVKVGSVPHPMEEKHYIKFIEVLTKDKVHRAELKPGDKPEADFCAVKDSVIGVREFCTVHMLWEGNMMS